ncbi:MAG: sulfatase-like hydrolase/transferase, partial [Pirellula sp.]|nr:sulfatase-like hydrolase/transferase [Pirellula sp.]
GFLKPHLPFVAPRKYWDLYNPKEIALASFQQPPAAAPVSFQADAPGRSLGSKSPNVLLICVDDLKPRLGCYGDPMAKTPSIDRLAKRGVRFDQAYCNQAVCSPSRNALLTSLRPQTLGIYDLQTNFRKGSPEAISLPQHFKSHGYHTQSFGKIFHVGHGNTDDTKSWSVESYKPKGRNYQTPENQNPENTKDKSKAAAFESADAAEELYNDSLIADAAIETIGQKASSDQPWLLAVGFLKPHLPFVAPRKYWDLYNPKEIALASFQQPPAAAPGVSFTDHQIGRLLESLDQNGLSDQTIVVLWGDHGWHLGDHGMWCKHSNYEQATRIPVVVSAPGKAKNASSQALIESVDIYPTLCELAGIESPSGLDGKSFARVLNDPSLPHRDHAIQVYPRSKEGTGQVLGRSIRTDRYRLVQWKAWAAPEESSDWELYDYQVDPLETKNLAPERPELVADLRKFLDTHPQAKPPVKEELGSGNSGNSTVGSSEGSKPTDREALFAKKDANADGYLTYQEFMQGQKDPEQAKGRFGKFDADRDNKLSRSEFVSSGKPSK